MFLFFVGMTGFFIGYPVFAEVSGERQLALYIAQAASSVNLVFTGLNAWPDIKIQLAKI